MEGFLVGWICVGLQTSLRPNLGLPLFTAYERGGPVVLDLGELHLTPLVAAASNIETRFLSPY